MILRVRNWAKYQHYKDRNPPWIKLHFAMLSSKDWVMMNDSERVLAVACMLIASQSDTPDGSFDADPDYIKRVAYLSSTPDFNSLIKLGFLEDASGCKQTLADVRPETYKATYKAKEKEKSSAKGSKPKSAKLGLADFLAECDTAGEKPIPADDPIFAYAAKVGLPVEFVALAWIEFKEKYAEKTQTGVAGWRQAFRNAVKGNWYRLWYDDKGIWALTTAGVQAQRAQS